MRTLCAENPVPDTRRLWNHVFVRDSTRKHTTLIGREVQPIIGFLCEEEELRRKYFSTSNIYKISVSVTVECLFSILGYERAQRLLSGVKKKSGT